MDQEQLAICQWLDNNQHRAVKLLQKLVEQPSTQGNEASAQAIVLEKCRQIGLEIDIWEPGGKKLKSHRHFYSTRSNFKESPNIAAVLKGSGGGKSLIFNGHIDVVPEGDLEQWDREPFFPKLENGNVYGRGTSDMKGGNVSMLMALEAISRCQTSIKGDIIFQSVIEEESGGAGTLDAILRGWEADAAIIPEPTNMKIFPKQQGSMWFKVIVHGKSAHGGTRYEGVSAIEKAMMVMNHIRELEKVRNDRITDPLYASTPIPIPINIGKITGGNWPSSVPDRVILEGRCGVAPNEQMEEVQQEMQEYLERLAGFDPWFADHPAELQWYGARWLPNELEPDHLLIDCLVQSFKEVTGEQPVMEASPWGTDAGMISAAGSIPSIVFGPGITETAHHPNEYIPVKNVIQAAKVMALFALKWCRTSKGESN
ncbi:MULTISPECIES: peptidase [Bacillaceae]|uniref:Peptidase n=1 Tax=Metabacillus sediminis TaxID=3117746 RepID=A0ABZ2NBT1_9BACI|nr:peptidase [Bacillus sp. SJS]KZZ84262.1 acetylornithine deacetylase [Bacillus sp. SJS]